MARWWTATVAGAAVLLALGACDGRADDADRLPLNGDPMEAARAGWSAQFGARIDSGNVAYREGRYDESAAVFRRATEQDPDVAAAWFGLHMAERARGDQEAAAEALRQAEALTPGLGGGHPASPMTDSPHGDLPPTELPPGHPPLPGT